MTNNRVAGDAFNSGGLTDASGRGSSFIADHALVGSLTSVFSSSIVNDARFQLATRRVVLRTADRTGPSIEIPGVLSFGRPYEGNSFRRENHYEAADTLLLAHGSHLLKVGATINRVRLRADIFDGFGGIYLFDSLPDFLRGNAANWRQAFGNPHTDFPVTSYGGFVQDHWSAGHKLTVDLGLRYDFQALPTGFNRDIDNVSPRIGIAYGPAPNWVVRAGYGVFFDRYVLAFLNRAVEKSGLRAFEQVLNGSPAATLFTAADGGPAPAPALPLAPSVFRPDPNLATPYSQQASFGVERLISRDWTASANYLFVRGVKLPRILNANLLPPVLLTPANAPALGILNPPPQQIGREVFVGRRNPRFDDIYELQDRASSSYHGVLVELKRRLAKEAEFSADYTFSKTLDDASDFDEQPQSPFSLRAERARSRNDQRHRFVFSALFDLPFGEEENATKPEGELGRILENIELAPILTISSGRPMNPLVGLDLNRNDAFPLSSRPLGMARNSLRTPSFAALDLRALKFLPIRGHRARLDLVAEFFNLFNHLNVNDINPFFGTASTPLPDFGRPIDASNPRQIQFSIDFEF